MENKELKPTIAGLKRVINIGDRWSTSVDHPHRKTWRPGSRRVAVKDTVKFGFNTKGRVSYCDWPKPSELVTLREDYFVIKKGLLVMTYTKDTKA